MRALGVMCILLRENRNSETWEQIKVRSHVPSTFTFASEFYVIPMATLRMGKCSE